MQAIALAPEERSRSLDALDGDAVDVLVVGGGVVGAGVAVDAAARGLSVALLERGDWAGGTSSRSTRLLHGGVRGLETGDRRLVAEALRERNLIAHRLAPHLVRPVSMLYPLTHRAWERAYAGFGGLVYDRLGWQPDVPQVVPAFGLLSRSACLAEAPALRPGPVRGAVRLGEGQLDDARFTLTLVRTAAALGARCVSRARVTRLRLADGAVRGADWTDVETGRELRTSSRVVICGVGVWTPDLLAGVGTGDALPVRPSKGVHLVVSRHRIESSTGLILRTTPADWRTRSFVLVVPWDRSHWVLGSTDSHWAHDRDRPAATRADVDFLLDRSNRMLRSPLRHRDVEAAYAGLRPLVQQSGRRNLSLVSRGHRIVAPLPGLVVTAGGKLTTYRSMAAQAVDVVAGRQAGPGTRELPLLGAAGWPEQRGRLQAMGRRSGLPPAAVDRLLRRYGTEVRELLAQGQANPELLQPLPGAEHHLRVEVTHAVRNEDARTLDDVLARRTRVAVDTADAGWTAAVPTARLMAPLLGWSRARVDREVAAYRRDTDRRRAERLAPDDAAAAALW